MKTLVWLEVEHAKPIQGLANKIAQRAYTLDGVSNAEPMRLQPLSADELEHLGFTMAEIALGSQDIKRG